MRAARSALLSCLLVNATAAAQPVTGSGAEVFWLAPREGALIDVTAGSLKPIALGGAQRLPAHGWLAAQLRAGELVWVHLPDDPQGQRVRFGFLSGGADGAASVDVTPERRGPGDFVLAAPVGPPTWLGLSVRPGQEPPRAQIWVGAIKSPGYRWELWEEQAKRWAAAPKQAPPAPPDLVGEPLVDRLDVIKDAVALAQLESADAGETNAAVSALLRAEALLADLPAREPLFPYFRRKELTPTIAQERPQQKIEGLRMVEVKEAEPARFTVDGPSILRIEARARFAADAPRRALPLQLVLRSGKRLLAVAAEEVAPHPAEDDPAQGTKGAEDVVFSSQRRIVLAAAPGRHTYELRVRGGAAWISVITHSRVVHFEDQASRAEDVPTLLRRARGGSSVLAELLAAEADFLSLADDEARARFQRVAEAAQHPRLRAFALLRLAALAIDRAQADAATQRALALLPEQDDAAARHARGMAVAEHLSRVIADLEPGAAAPPEAVALLRGTPQALPHMLGLVGPLLRYLPGYRALALPLLAAAQQRAPLDVALRHTLSREWFTGSRWATLPALDLGGAQRLDLLSPPRESVTCIEAAADGLPAYAPLPQQEATLQVPEALAPPQSLRRFQLIALRRGAPRLGWTELVLDGERARLPLILAHEHVPLALAAGRHSLRSVPISEPVSREAAGERPVLLAPCALLPQRAGRALLLEQRFSVLGERGAAVRVLTLEPGTPGFLGLELRPSPALRSGHLLVRSDQGVLGRIVVHGHGRDPKAIGAEVGPSVVVVLPLPAAAQQVDITREDDGAPILVAARLRRSFAALRLPDTEVVQRRMGGERDPQHLEKLRLATRALRSAKDEKARARARLQRAEVLLALDAPMMARADLGQVLPVLDDERALRRARALLVATSLPALIPRRPDGPGAVILLAGAGLTATAAESACVSDAVARFARDAAAGRAAAARCPGLVGAYAAAQLEEQGGSLDRAAQHYADAYMVSIASGHARPALAREAALRTAERGPGRGSQRALALAVAAEQDEDPEGERAVARLHGLAHLTPVRGVDAGRDARGKEQVTPTLSLHAALADEPWEPGQFLELRAGKSTETDLMVTHSLRVRVEALCDDGGELLPSPPPCGLRVEADGAPLADAAAQLVRPGERARLAELSFNTKGAHRIKVVLERKRGAARAFVRFLTSRPLPGAPSQATTEGDYALPILSPPLLRFTGTAAEPVQLRAQGSTALRLDALAAPYPGERAIAVELAVAGHDRIRRVYPICTRPDERKAPPERPEFDCRSVLLIPLLHEGTYQVSLRPVGAPSLALAMSLYEDEPPVPPAEAADAKVATNLPEVPSARAEIPGVQSLPRPMSNLVRSLGTLQVQQLGVFGSNGRNNPQIGDTYGETSIAYRRRIEGIPLWLKGSTLLRLRDGSPTYGLQGLLFGRIPLLDLRVYAQLQGFTQSVQGKQEYALALNSYLERSFAVIPHLFVLPRFAFTANYLTLQDRPSLRALNGGGDPVDITPIDLSIYNPYDATHRTGIYGQLMVWGVPFINMIAYGMVRVTSNQNIHMLDAVTGRFGVDLVLRTTELVADYEVAQYVANDARRAPLLRHRIGADLKQTIWINRNHRIGLSFGANLEAVSRSSTFTLGLFWEGSHGRGLDDYATPEINLPQQLSQGRSFQRPEETLR